MDEINASTLKEQGNAAFRAKDYREALRLYTEAMDIEPNNVSYPLNRCMTYLKLEMWSEAEVDATKALTLSPREVKALYRRSIARREQKDFRGAKHDIWAFSHAGGEWTHLVDQCEKISASEGESIVNDGFEVKESVGKGLGAFATRTFQRGDMILAEKPLFTIGSQMRFVIKSTVAGLSESQKEAFMSLSPGAASRYDDPVVDRYCTNAFKTETRDVEALESIFLTASRFNHGCMRNARYGWNEGSGQLRIYALRDIAVGEEIEVSFLGPPERHRAVQSERQAILEKNWGFVCACAVCMLPSAEREKSDRRRSEIARMRGGLQSLTGPFQGERFLQEVMDIIRVMKKEGYIGEIADSTKEMVARCAVHSDWQSVEYWVRKTYQIIFEEWGADHRSAKAVPGPFRGQGLLGA